jgi:Spy/CpxP family protein refolding chaperone
MKVKAIFAIAVMFVLSLAANSYAQMGGGMSPEERMKRTLEEYKTKLTLTEEQVVKVEAILKAQTEEMAAIRANAGGDREAMRTAITELRTKTDKQVEELLTDEQKVIFKKLQEERAQRMQGMGRG